MENILHVGLDVGSTTVKIVVIDSNKKEIYSDYTRHFSDTKNTVCKVLESLPEKFQTVNLQSHLQDLAQCLQLLFWGYLLFKKL